MRARTWEWLDRVGHILYEPTNIGRRVHRHDHRWHHNLHVLPGRVVGWICHRYDMALGLYDDDELG